MRRHGEVTKRNRFGDVPKVDADEDEVGGDEASDCTRDRVRRTVRFGVARKVVGL